jgi:threonine dehydratase
MGAFKMRGAVNAILSLSDDQKIKGVATHSSGNFAQAVALAARNTGIKAFIVMPSDAPVVKKSAVAGYGAYLIESQPGLKAREEMLQKVVEETGATFIHPSNNIDVIYGNATSAFELLTDYPDLQQIVTPVGGGGLLAGTALATKALNPSIEIYAGEPFGADDAYWSLRKGIIQPSINPQTIADGLKTQLGDINFPIIRQNVTDIIRVEENAIKSSMRIIWERMKIIVEPSSAVALAAVFTKPELFRNKKTGIILSGGNVDLSRLPEYFD